MMKAAILSEFAAVRSSFLQMIGLYAIVGIIVGISIGSLFALIACVAAMSPFMMSISFAGLDATNGWERYRACLPLSRADIVASRYVNIILTSLVMVAVGMVIVFALGSIAPYLPLGADMQSAFAEELADPVMILAAGMLGMAVTMTATAIMMPLIFKFGLTKTVRFSMIGCVLVAGLGMGALAQLPLDPGLLADITAWLDDPSHAPLMVMALVCFILGVCAISCGISIAVYRTKEL